MFKINTIKIRSDFFWIFVLSFIVLIPNVYLFFVGSDLSGTLFKRLAYLSFSTFLFLIPSLFLKARTFFLYQGIFVLLAPFEIAHIYLNKMPISFGFLLAILDTNKSEAFELLSSIKVFVIFVLVIWVIYFFIAIKKIKNEYFLKSIKKRLIVLLFMGLSAFCGLSYFYYLGKKISTNENNFSYTIEKFTVKFYKIYPFDIIYKMQQVYFSRKEIKSKREELANFSFHAVKQNSVNQREIYVFIIGETARYDNFSVNGYFLPTSPMLEKVENLISYSNFFSEANVTLFSLPIILTRATPLDHDRANYEKSFVDAFKEVGFKTYWIANQSASNNFIRRISKDTDDEFFIVTDFDARDNFDEKLWTYFDEILSKNEDKVLIVLHTLGSHFRYNFRYPSQYDVFQPSFKGAFDYSLISIENKEHFINTYNNSILYTDYFLSNTINKLDSLNAVSTLIYTSDHGENLFDTEENIVLHGGTVPTKYDFHVPLFIWTSEKYRSLNESKVQNMYLNKDKKLSISSIFYSILDVADISFPEQNLKKSFASEELEEDSVRYYYNINRDAKKIPE